MCKEKKTLQEKDSKKLNEKVKETPQHKYKTISIQLENGQFLPSTDSYCPQQMCIHPTRPYFDSHRTQTISSKVLKPPPLTPPTKMINKNIFQAQEKVVKRRSNKIFSANPKWESPKGKGTQIVSSNQKLKSTKGKEKVSVKVKCELPKRNRNVWLNFLCWPKVERQIRYQKLKTKDQIKKLSRKIDKIGKIPKEIVRENKKISQRKTLSVDKRLRCLRIETAKNNVAQEVKIAQNEKIKEYKVANYNKPNKIKQQLPQSVLRSNALGRQELRINMIETEKNIVVEEVEKTQNEARKGENIAKYTLENQTKEMQQDIKSRRSRGKKRKITR